jgi:DNA (cytosine-5)-methyltransferase 1
MLRQTFTSKRSTILRAVTTGALTGNTETKGNADASVPPAHRWWMSHLRGTPVVGPRVGTVHTVDLFCGVGGLSLGATEAIGAAGLNHRPLVAVDVDEDALAVYRHNFPGAKTICSSVASLVDFHVYGRGETAQLAYAPEVIDPRLEEFVGRTDLLIAGPPCQGHSNLNNHTRRSDPRNMLYLCAIATALALRTRMVVIENVPDVLSDKTDVVGTGSAILRNAGYHVSDSVLNTIELGGAQTRKRHFLVATRSPHTGLGEAATALEQPPMTLREVIGDLAGRKPGSFMDEMPVLSVENQARIDYLFKHRLFDLPDKVRPDCHKNGHTYPSVYGRLAWDKPSQTITTGFMTPGRGRFIHPSEKRVLTAREAARIQGFPDTFSFAAGRESPSKKLLSKWIGDAVPVWLGYTAVLAALSGNT